MPLVSVSSTFFARSASQGQNLSRIHFDFARCSIRRRDVVPAIHRAGGNSFEHHDFARAGRGQRRENEIFPDAGDDVEVHSGMRLPRSQPLDISEREGALWCIVLALLRVALEQAGDVALACRDDDEVRLRSVFFEVGGRGGLVFDRCPRVFPAPASSGEILRADRRLAPACRAIRSNSMYLLAGSVRCGDRHAESNRPSGIPCPRNSGPARARNSAPCRTCTGST